ncbi:MAG: TonB-dependent receptor domain-containing protein [Gemmatimonadaceae bacterium]
MLRLCRTCAFALVAVAAGAWLHAIVFVPALHAQGVTTGAIGGVVTDTSGAPIDGAQVQVVNRSSGFTSGASSRANGRYFVQGLEVGGPYSVTVRRIGFQSQTQDGVVVALSQLTPVDFQLVAQAAVLAGVRVEAEEDPLFAPSRMGTGALVSDSALRRLPTLNRNFTDFVVTAPQVSSAGPGLSGGGVNNRFNQIQIDGASEVDVFGLGATGQPGGQARGKSVPLEAVKEYQVLLSPYDVRQGTFSGLLVNAVTKSGTNDFRATAFYVTRNEKLARDVEFIRKSQFDQSQYGFSIGGPIRRDKVHFFFASEFQQRTAPSSGPFLGQIDVTATPVPVTQADVDRFVSILQTQYNLDPGSTGRLDNDNPLTNIFGRVDAQLPWSSRLVLRHNYGKAEDDNFGRSGTTYLLGSNAFFFESVKHGTVGQLFTAFRNGWDNELIVGYNRIRDARTPMSNFPTVSVTVQNPAGGNATLRAGSEQFSQGNTLDQDIYEFSDNLTFPIGSHRITIGTKNDRYHIRNLFTESSFGVYSFRNLDSLAAGNPSSYRVAKDLGNGVVAEFDAGMYGVYAQDAWRPSGRLSVNYGLRLDVPVLHDKPRYTPVVDSLYGRRTDEVPSGNLQWSPRIGVNYDLSTEDVRSQVRGGIGVFVGRPAFVWVGNAFQNSGSNLGFLNCGGAADPGPAPQFEPDPNNQSVSCRNGQGLRTGVVGPVNLLDDKLKFPQTLRGSLAYDRELPWWGLVATLEGLYTLGLNNFFYINRNLVGTRGTDRNGRVIYGDSIRTNGAGRPALVSSRFSEVIDVTNQSEDYSYNLTAQLEKRFANNFEARASYTYSRARDVQSLTSSRAISNWRFGRSLSGDHLDQGVGISAFDQPHKVQLSGTYTAPWTTWKTDVSLIYAGISGNPFEYIYRNGPTFGSGDLNADGVQGNDLIYVPTDATNASQIQFRDFGTGAGLVTAAQQATAFEQFIKNSECLSEQRGKILERNSCRTPWQNIVNVSLRQSLPSFQRHTLSLQLDVFNFLNLLNKEWGAIEFPAGGFSQEPVLTHVGQTAGPLTTSQGIFQFDTKLKEFDSTNLSSNYQVQLQVRYSF